MPCFFYLKKSPKIYFQKIAKLIKIHTNQTLQITHHPKTTTIPSSNLKLKLQSTSAKHNKNENAMFSTNMIDFTQRFCQPLYYIFWARVSSRIKYFKLTLKFNLKTST
jgi:hypothetical protein